MRLESLEGREVPATLPTGFSEAVVASGLTSPTAMELSPDGKLFVAQQNGAMQVWQDGTRLRQNFFATSPISTDSTGERGLLGIAFDPDYANNRYVYAYYTTLASDRHNRVSRFTANADGDQALANSQLVLWEGDAHAATNHNGGAIHFGPDGKLYIATGDNANGATAQSLSSLHGKVLRINPDGSIPTDNPFVAQTTGRFQAIWALGLRNPFTFAFQPGSSRMFVNDVGQQTWEEINNGVAGSNYGWPNTEGPAGNPPSGPGTYRAPVFAYDHGGAAPNGVAITGGTFYNPTTNSFGSVYEGDYFFSDVGGSWIYRLDFNPATGQYASAPVLFASNVSAPVDLKVDNDGNLLYLSRGANAVYEVRATPAPSITQQPQSLTVTTGNAAAFSVVASGAGLTYQWQRADAASPNTWANISGATGANFSLSTTSAADNGDRFRVVVRNAGGSIVSDPAVLTVSTNQAPTVTISLDSGLRNGKFDAGSEIAFSGTATDPEEGPIDVVGYTWQIDYLTSINSGDVDRDGLPGLTRPFVPAFSGVNNGTFTPANIGPYTLADVAYVVTLTASDSTGRTTVQRTIVSPNTATITLQSNVPGLQVTRDGQPVTVPNTFTGVVGFRRAIGAEASQTLGAIRYEFSSWSDGGAATHDIVTPEVNTTYTANYNAAEVTGRVRVEAETLTRSGAYVVENWPTSVASAGKLISLANGRPSPQGGSASGVFQGPTGFYEVILTHFDENDGGGHLTMSINRASVGSWPLGQMLGSSMPTAGTRVMRNVGIFNLSQGTPFQINGSSHLGDPARVDYVEFVPIQSAPAAPTDLTAVRGNQQVRLTWNRTNQTTGYNVYRRTETEPETQVASNLTTPTYTDTGLTKGTRHIYRVTAVNPIGEGPASAEASAVPRAVVRAINAGGVATGAFQQDGNFSGGAAARVTNTIDVSQVAEPASQEVYRTVRAGTSRYTLGGLTPGAAYTVRLHFSENYAIGAGQRVFHVRINGNQVLTNFDVFAQAGGRFRAITRDFATTADSQGRLVLDFLTVVGNARVSGIEVFLP